MGINIEKKSSLNYCKHKFYKKKVYVSLQKFKPIIFSPQLTKRCNLNCSWCVANTEAKKGNVLDYEVDLDLMKKFLANSLLDRCLYVSLTGGEPLLNKSIFDIVRYTRGSGRFVSLATNGILLADSINDLVSSGINLVDISLYPTNIERVSKHLEKINSIFRTRLNKIILRSTLENNVQELFEVAELARSCNSLGIQFYYCFPATSEFDNEVVYDDNKLLWDFKAEIKSRYPDVSLDIPAPMKRSFSSTDKVCSLPWNYVNADAQGNMGLCCRHYPHTDSRYGNFLNSAPEEAFNIPIRKKMRSDLLNPDIQIPALCKDCYFLIDKTRSNY